MTTQQPTTDRRGNANVLLETVASLAGLVVVDVGCGDGALVRLMARHGAHVSGLDPSPEQVARARATAPVADETYGVAAAEALPLTSASVDLVVFFNSLHHVPVDLQAQALAEAARVLKADGRLYLSEPLAEGPFFELTRLIDDETAVRAAAYTRLQEAERFGLRNIGEIHHVNTLCHADFAAFRQRIVAIDVSRAPAVAENEAALRTAFETHGQASAEGWLFEQPMRVNLLRRVAG